MRSDRFEYFATEEDHAAFFSKIDSEFDLKIVERCYDKGRGPLVFEGLLNFLGFLNSEADRVARRSIFYACFNPSKLKARDIVGSDKLSEFNLVENPDVLAFGFGEQLDHERILLSQIGRSKDSMETKELLSRLKRIAKSIDGETAVTVTGEHVFPCALSFADRGGRLVRTPDAPSAFDAQITR